MNYVILLKLCDRMQFEVNCAKSHHLVISDGLLSSKERMWGNAKCFKIADGNLSDGTGIHRLTHAINIGNINAKGLHFGGKSL